MAERRMFARKIINSAKFLKMPASSQALYFHLGLNADDDGIVEAFPIMRQMGASEDDLKILVAKGFVIVLNEDLVAYITDWQSHNRIRADRKIDSIYKPLLLQMLPDVSLIEPRTRTDTAKKEQVKIRETHIDLDVGQTMDGQQTDSGQTVDGQWADNGRHSIGKDRLGKSRLGEKENEIPDGISQKKILKKSFPHDSKAYKCARWLSKQVLTRYPYTKAHGEDTLQRWADDIDKCNRLDGYEWEDISDVIRFSQQDKFWQENIRSGAAVRKQFETLMIKMRGDES